MSNPCRELPQSWDESQWARGKWGGAYVEEPKEWSDHLSEVKVFMSTPYRIWRRTHFVRFRFENKGKCIILMLEDGYAGG